MKTLITDKIAPAGVDILREHTDVDVQLSMTPEELLSVIPKYEALIVRSQTKVTKGIINAAKKLLVIGRAGIGLDNIDVDAATRCGILVVNSPEGNLVSTAEHKDRPGIVGVVGTILGNAGININQMQVSRGVTQENKAMMLLCLDEPLTTECHQKIIAIPDMYKVFVVKLS